MIGARAVALREKFAADAKERQRASGGDRKSERAKSVPELVPEPVAKGETRDQIGKLVGVTGRTIQDAVKVIEKGIPELAKAVHEGDEHAGDCRRSRGVRDDGQSRPASTCNGRYT